MREAMDRARLTSGQVAYRMSVSDGTVRCWTSGRRRIGTDDLARFAGIVGHPVEYFLKPDYQLPDDLDLRLELARLVEQVARLAERIEERSRTRTDDHALAYLREAHGLTESDLAAIQRIIAR